MRLIAWIGGGKVREGEGREERGMSEHERQIGYMFWLVLLLLLTW